MNHFHLLGDGVGEGESQRSAANRRHLAPIPLLYTHLCIFSKSPILYASLGSGASPHYFSLRLKKMLYPDPQNLSSHENQEKGLNE